jgi:hypothetical protein
MVGKWEGWREKVGGDGGETGGVAGSAGVLRRREYQKSVRETSMPDLGYGGGPKRCKAGFAVVQVLIPARGQTGSEPRLEGLRRGQCVPGWAQRTKNGQ